MKYLVATLKYWTCHCRVTEPRTEGSRADFIGRYVKPQSGQPNPISMWTMCPPPLPPPSTEMRTYERFAKVTVEKYLLGMWACSTIRYIFMWNQKSLQLEFITTRWRGTHACTKVCFPIEVSYKLTAQYTRQRNFTCLRDKSTVLPTPIFTKFANAQQHCLQICYTDLYLDRTIAVERTNRNLFTPLSKVLISLHRFSIIKYTITITTTIYCFLI
jgi:hypothetical protein